MRISENSAIYPIPDTCPKLRAVKRTNLRRMYIYIQKNKSIYRFLLDRFQSNINPYLQNKRVQCQGGFSRLSHFCADERLHSFPFPLDAFADSFAEFFVCFALADAHRLQIMHEDIGAEFRECRTRLQRLIRRVWQRGLLLRSFLLPKLQKCF